MASPGQINLSEIGPPKKSVDVREIDARSRAVAVHWGFGVLLTTIVLGLLAYVALDVDKLPTDQLRQWLQMLVTGEIGLIAGLLGAPKDHGSGS